MVVCFLSEYQLCFPPFFHPNSYTIELDEKFADVIVNRYIEQAGSAENVFVERDGERIAWDMQLIPLAFG